MMGRETGAHAGAKGSQSRSLSFLGPARLSDRAGQGCAVSSGTDDVQTTDVHSHARPAEPVWGHCRRRTASCASAFVQLRITPKPVLGGCTGRHQALSMLDKIRTQTSYDRAKEYQPELFDRVAKLSLRPSPILA